MSEEDFDKKYKRLEKKFRLYKKKNNYRQEILPCCSTCAYSCQVNSWDEMTCENDGHYELTLNVVGKLDICDAYKKSTRIK